MSSLPPYYEQTTVGGTSTTGSAPTTTTTTTSDAQDFSSKAHTTSDHTTQNDPDAISAVPRSDKVNSEYESTTDTTQPRGSLPSTTEDAGRRDSALTSSVSQQSAPGRAGSIGEKALGALGYGGSKVERPKEDQGLGEKIVNFLGA